MPAPTIVNQWQITAMNTYGIQTAKVANSSGNALIAILSCASSSQKVLPRFNIADDAHNYWQFAGSSPNFNPGVSRRIDVWIAPNASSAQQVSVAESWFTSGVAGIIVEVANFPTWAVVDFVATGTNLGTSATIAGIATQSDFVFGGLATSAPDVTSFGTTPAGFTALTQTSTGISGSDQTSLSLYPLWGSFAAGAVSAAWSWTGNSFWTGILVGFSAAPSAPPQVNPNWPGLKVEAAFGWQPGNLTGVMPTWTDITARAQDEQGNSSFKAGRGRDYELTQPAAGTQSMRLANQDGAFNPNNVPAANVAFAGNGSVSPQVENFNNQVPVTPNAFYGSSAYIWQNSAWASGVLFLIAWYTSGGTFISSTNLSVSGSSSPVLQTVIGQAPGTAAFADISVVANGTPGSGVTFFAAATGLTPYYPGTTALQVPSNSVWVPKTGTTIQSQNGWTPSAPYYPYVLPETPVRTTAVWQPSGKTFPVAFTYANKFPQTFDYPQWGMTPYQGSDGIGMASQIRMPSALGGDILIDFPYLYFPCSEFFSVAGGEPLANASRSNIRPAVCVDDTDRNAGFPLQTGQALNLAGDTGTGIGITGVAAGPPANHGGAAGAYYRDPGIPQLAPGFTVEFEAALNATGSTINGNVDIIRLIGNPWNYFAQDAAGTTVGDGTRLLVNISRLNTGGASMTATLAGHSGATVTASSATGLIADNNTHHYAVSAWWDGSTWHILCYIDGTQVASTTGTAVESNPVTYILAMGPVILGSGTRAAGNYTLGHVTAYGWVLNPNRIASHHSTGATGGSGESIPARYARLHAWSGVQLPKAATLPSPSPQAGSADQIQGSALSDCAYQLSQEDGGMYYADGWGNSWQVTRSWFYNQQAKWTFSDQPGGTPFMTGTGFDYSDSFLWNITKSLRTISSSTQLFTGAQNPGQAALGTFNSYGADAIGADFSSEAQFLPRGPLEQPVETTSDQDAFDRANWSLAKYRLPQLRPNQILLDPTGDPSIWPVVLGVEQGDIVSLSRSPLGAATITILAIVQKVEHTAGPSRWATVFTLAPYFPEGNVIQLDATGFNTPSSGVLPW